MAVELTACGCRVCGGTGPHRRSEVAAVDASTITSSVQDNANLCPYLFQQLSGSVRVELEDTLSLVQESARYSRRGNQYLHTA